MKPKASSRSSLEPASPLNPTVTLAVPSNATKGKEKAKNVWVPKTNENLMKKDSVPLSPSTSKLTLPLHMSTTSFPKLVSDSEEAVLSNTRSPPFSGKPSPSSSKPCKQADKNASSSKRGKRNKNKASSKASLEAASPLNPTVTLAVPSNATKRKEKATNVWVPKANENLMNEDSVPLSPPTSKLTLPLHMSTTSFPELVSDSEEAVLSNTGSPPFSGKPSPSSSSSKRGKRKNNKDKKRKKNKHKTPVYSIPKDIERIFKKDKVPPVLLNPLSPSTYKQYFAALLYAEDYYIEKWNGFTLVNVSLKIKSPRMENKIFVAFEIDSVPENRPFLLSRDFVFARPSGEQRDPFKGFVKGVKKSTLLIAEFGEDFLCQHRSLRRYDVSFSFNRVCLKRFHQAIAAASEKLAQSFIFPDNVSKTRTLTRPENWCSHELSGEQKSAVRHILSSHGPPPYLVEGPLCVTSAKKNPEQLSETGMVVKEAVVQILISSSACRVLICAPINNTCDVLARSLMKEIPESDLFRANAAFREIHGVPVDILDLSLYEEEEECFTCPSLEELKKYRVILSTFVSSFRIFHEGLPAGHFSHIFLVDASSASEPETMVALSNFATAATTVVVTGSRTNSPRWIRSDIARKHGLRLSYFQRLIKSEPSTD